MWRQVKATLALVIVIVVVVLVRVLVLLLDGPAGSTMCTKISIPRLREIYTGTHTHTPAAHEPLAKKRAGPSHPQLFLFVFLLLLSFCSLLLLSLLLL